MFLFATIHSAVSLPLRRVAHICIHNALSCYDLAYGFTNTALPQHGLVQFALDIRPIWIAAKPAGRDESSNNGGMRV